jgi:hypothetical protein
VNARVRAELRGDVELLSAAAEATPAALRALFLSRTLDATLPKAAHAAALAAAEQQLARDPFDAAAQRVVEAEIKLRNVDENRTLAHEHMPEAFVRGDMLYIRIKVNGVECMP